MPGPDTPGSPHPPAPALLPQHLNPADSDSQTQRAYGFYEGVTCLHPSTGLGSGWAQLDLLVEELFWLLRGHMSKECGRGLC